VYIVAAAKDTSAGGQCPQVSADSANQHQQPQQQQQVIVCSTISSFTVSSDPSTASVCNATTTVHGGSASLISPEPSISPSPGDFTDKHAPSLRENGELCHR